MNQTTEEDWIRNFLIPKLLENDKLIEDTSKIPENFILRDISIKYLGSEESFMLTKCYKANINYEYNGKEYSTTILVKKTPQLSEDAYKSVSFDALFHNEILAYTEIIPILNASKNYAKHYYSHRKDVEAVLVLGDFSLTGWRMTKSKVNLSLEHIMLAVKALGQFHGSGFAFKHNDPDKFRKIISSLREPRYGNVYNEEWLTICTTSSKRSIDAARKFQNLSQPTPNEFLDKLLELIGDIIEYGKKRVQPVEPLATICHGDYLRNNMAFKYDEKNPDIPIDVLVFDFQTLRYSSPMVDLTTFMCLSTGKDVRPDNFESIFTAYWNELTEIYCERTGILMENLPPYLSYDSLQKEYIRYLPYGLATASSFLMTLFDPGDINVEDILNGLVRTQEEIIKDVNTRGGEPVDIELSALVHELYQFSVKKDVNIFEGF